MTRRRLLAAGTAVMMVTGLAVGAVGALATAPWASASSRVASQDVSVARQDIGRSMVVIGTGGLSWSDVSPTATPSLWALLRDGATAALTVHAVHANTCPVDGWLSLSAGERAGDIDAGGAGSVDGGGDGGRGDGGGGDGGGGDGGGPDGAKPPCQPLPSRMTAGKVPHWDAYRAAASATRFGASPGLLGDQVAAHGGCIQAVGPGAALGAARGNGIVDRYQPFHPSTLTAALATCPATLVDVGLIRDPSDVDPRDAERPTTPRAQQVAAVDGRVAAVLKAAPTGTDVVLASLADAGVTARLRLVAVSGPGFGAGFLESASTRHQGLVQLADLTATILEHLDIPRPRSLGGAPLQFVPSGGNSEESAADRLTTLLDYDEASQEVHGLVEPFFYGWVLLQGALYLAGAVLWRRGGGGGPKHVSSGTSPARTHVLAITRRVAIIAATVPVSTFLANLLPWWRFHVPLAGVVACVAVFAAAISALALLRPWRRSLFGPLVVVCGATMAVLAADVMTGSRLQVSSLMGLQPVVGGRFYGMGNVTFALFATATLMLCTAVGGHFVTLRQPRTAAVVVASIGLVAVIIDAAPSWGSDFGGPPALLPGLILLVLAILQIRITWRRVLAIAGGTGAFVLVLGLLDWLRPAESRSHLGRFVQTALDGDGWDIIARKLDQNLTLLFGNRLLLLVPVGLVLIAYVLARPASPAARPLRRSLERVPLLRPGLTAVLVMWLIGFALNDSGAAIPAVGATLVLPLLIALAVRTVEEAPPAGPGATRASRARR